MKRFVLSLVTALSLMGAAQAFAVPVPVTEPLQNNSAGVYDQTFSWGGAQSTQYTNAIPTRLMVSPSRWIHSADTGGNPPDSTMVAMLRIHPAASQSGNLFADTMYVALQVSMNGTDWLAWAPGTLEAQRATTLLGTNQAIAVSEADADTTNESFWFPLRLDFAGEADDAGAITTLGLAAAAVTTARGWMTFPLIRFAIQSDAIGDFVVNFRRYEDKPGRIAMSSSPLSFRHTGTVFASGVSDSGFTTGVGSHTGSLLAFTDTTTAASYDGFCLPATSYYGSGIDSLRIGYLKVFADPSAGTTAGWDSVYVTPQFSFDGATWLSGNEHGVIETAGLDTYVHSFKVMIKNQTGAAAYNSAFGPGILPGAALDWYNSYGTTPLIRFIIRRDNGATGPMRAVLRTWKWFND
jgi:hypothetical protein